MNYKSLLLATLVMTLSCSHKDKKPEEYEVMKTTAVETAEVTDVDYTNRKITLSGKDGPVVISAGDEVKNLNQIKKGDTVVAQYEEALVYSIDKGGKIESPEVSASEWSAKPGKEPGAGVKAELTASLLVADINRNKPSVTLQNNAGELQTFKVAHPERLKVLDVGDVVNVKYSEAMALKVEKKSI